MGRENLIFKKEYWSDKNIKECKITPLEKCKSGF
jgi:hypothetical protein